jgi:hypothetical protein
MFTKPTNKAANVVAPPIVASSLQEQQQNKTCEKNSRQQYVSSTSQPNGSTEVQSVKESNNAIEQKVDVPMSFSPSPKRLPEHLASPPPSQSSTVATISSVLPASIEVFSAKNEDRILQEIKVEQPKAASEHQPLPVVGEENQQASDEYIIEVR